VSEYQPRAFGGFSKRTPVNLFAGNEHAPIGKRLKQPGAFYKFIMFRGARRDRAEDFLADLVDTPAWVAKRSGVDKWSGHLDESAPLPFSSRSLSPNPKNALHLAQ